MDRRILASVTLAAALTLAACTGGQETSAQEIDENKKTAEAAQQVDAAAQLRQLSPAIPLYAGASYRADFTRRDEVMIRNQYGDRSEVITLTSDDPLPKVWHYYVTYLAQYRAWEPAASYPPEKKEQRSLEVNLSEAMQDPFVPGSELKTTDRSVILQISETDGDPKTVIRYIITPQAPAAAVAAALGR
ncbi:MAG TPA: hypothetical protein VFV54_07790 [Thermoanaerobaculia bacterium]|nr:hypothetical protein [Thermoanaerobaculia bacterium]